MIKIMNKMHYMMNQLLLLGILLSLFFLILGGTLFIINDGNTQLVDFKDFHGEPKYLTFLPDIIGNAKNLQPKALIQIGLYTLFIMQILRIMLAGWFFIKTKDATYILMSLLIVFIMVGSLWLSI